jgi:hypothetical protein
MGSHAVVEGADPASIIHTIERSFNNGNKLGSNITVKYRRPKCVFVDYLSWGNGEDVDGRRAFNVTVNSRDGLDARVLYARVSIGWSN